MNTTKKTEHNTIPEFYYIDKYPEDIPHDRDHIKINDKLSIEYFANVSKYSLEFLNEMIIKQNPDTQIYKFEYLESEQKLFIYSDSYLKLSTHDFWYKRIRKNTYDIPDSFYLSEILHDELVVLLKGDNPCPKDSVPFSIIPPLIKKAIQKHQKQILALEKKLLNKFKSYNPDISNIRYEKISYTTVTIYIYYQNRSACTKIQLTRENNNTIQINNTENETLFEKPVDVDFSVKMRAALNEMHELVHSILDMDNFYPSSCVFCNRDWIFSHSKDDNISHIIISRALQVWNNIALEFSSFDLNTIKLRENRGSKDFPETFKKHIKKLLTKVYIRIDDCPEYLKDTLLQIRQNMDKEPLILTNPNKTPDNTSISASKNTKPNNILPLLTKSSTDLLNYLRQFKTYHLKIQDQNDEKKIQEELQNIFNYLTYLCQEKHYNINNLNINNFIDYLLLEKIINLNKINRLTIINNEGTNKIFLNVEMDNNSITIDNNNLLYNVLLGYIYNHLELFSENELLIIGINGEMKFDMLFVTNGYHNNDLKTNIDKLETIKDFLFERCSFEYNPNINYQELLNIKGSK